MSKRNQKLNCSRKSFIKKYFQLGPSFVVTSFLLLVCSVLMGCAGSPKFVRYSNSDTLAYYDKNHISEPKEREINFTWHNVDQNFFYRLERFFDLPNHLKSLFGSKSETKNANAFDEVDNSSWFTNRNAKNLLSLEEISRGPDLETGPDMSEPWTVIKAKTEGVTPGFRIKDSKGDDYGIKFDPPGYPELASAAEVISTKLFYAAGYNTPENFIVYFSPGQLRLGPKVSIKDKNGKKREMTKSDLDSLLKSLPKDNQGKIRALASKWIKNGKGPFSYRGRRKDDRNDRINHEDRRELRGLKVLCAWLNHFDTKDHNTLDAYVTEDEKKYLRHYLIDFGSTLGSAATGSKSPMDGYAHFVDVEYSLQNLISVGLVGHPWERSDSVWHPAVGYFESETFDPSSWKPINPNVAFDKMTDRDAFWGAKLVASFTDEQIKSAVESGQISDPAAEDYLIKTLIERRNKIAKHWFSKVNHLDHLMFSKNADGSMALSFADLLSRINGEEPNQVSFRYTLYSFSSSQELGKVKNQKGMSHIILDGELMSALDSYLSNKKSTKEGNIFYYEIRCSHQYPEKWGHKIKVYFRYQGKQSTPILLGLER